MRRPLAALRERFPGCESILARKFSRTQPASKRPSLGGHDSKHGLSHWWNGRGSAPALPGIDARNERAHTSSASCLSRVRNGPTRFGGFEVDHQIELLWPLYRQVTWLCAVRNPADATPASVELVVHVRPAGEDAILFSTKRLMYSDMPSF
jgi:hypothetical protein